MSEIGFFNPSRTLTVGEIAGLTKARLVDDAHASVRISHLAPLAGGTPQSLVFAARRKSLEEIGRLTAAAILCPEDAVPLVPEGIAVLASRNPHRDFAAVARLVFPDAVRPSGLSGKGGIAPSAFVDPGARLEDGVSVEHGAFIGRGAEIGSGTTIAPNAVIGPDCRIGRDCYIGPGVHIQHSLISDRVFIHPGVAIGQDGFGYVPGPGGAEKVPQLGRVVIQNDVEIGANSTIDRGALGDTVIGEATKIDNLVQIAHNVRIGSGCMIAGNCGLAGSVTLGDYVMLGGQVGIADHITIGSFVQLSGGSGVMNDIPPHAIWGGRPAKPIKEAFREQALLRDLVRRGRGRAAEK